MWIGGDRRSGFPAFEQQASEVLAVLIATDQFANVCATGPEPPTRDLFVDKRLEGRGQGDVHGAHVASVAVLTKNGKAGSWENRPELGTGERP